MMGGLTFMVKGKMCVGIIIDEMMCRIDPEFHNAAIEQTGCRTMDFTKRPMKGYVMVDDTGMKTKKEFEYWLGLALTFNKKAKSSKTKKNKKQSFENHTNASATHADTQPKQWHPCG